MATAAATAADAVTYAKQPADLVVGNDAAAGIDAIAPLRLIILEKCVALAYNIMNCCYRSQTAYYVDVRLRRPAIQQCWQKAACVKASPCSTPVFV